MARLLIAAPGQQPSHLLQSLKLYGGVALPLFPDVAARYVLSPADWCLVPPPCPGLAASLPTVLQRSTAEAALLVAHLPAAERCRLQTAALCLHRAEAMAGFTLQQPLLWRILTAGLN